MARRKPKDQSLHADSTRGTQKSRSGKSGRWRRAQLSKEVIFAVCDEFFHLIERDGKKKDEKKIVASVIEAIRAKYGITDVTRQRVYPIIREGVRRGLVLLNPPLTNRLAQRIVDVYGLHDLDKQAIRVVDVENSRAHGHVAFSAARLAQRLIHKIADERNGGPVHIGLGVGLTSLKVARGLGRLLNSDPQCPRLVVHALCSPGLMKSDPRGVPTSFLRYLENRSKRIEFVGLDALPVVRWADYEHFKQSAPVQEAFRRAEEIDIVVTAIACSDHVHGVWNHYLKYISSLDSQDRTGELLEQAGWIGDVQYLPYSQRAPIVLNQGYRSVVLFDIPDLVRMARSGEKYVLVVAGPCAKCRATRTEALRPLVEEPDLRVWSHLVTDVRTARELLPEHWNHREATQEESGD